MTDPRSPQSRARQAAASSRFDREPAPGEFPTAVTDEFAWHFGTPSAFVVRSPGRVNLIGEHTDYNDGFVLPLAIERAAWVALSPRADRRVRVRSIDFGDESELDLDRLERGEGWSEYVKGTAWAIEQSGHELRGWDGVVGGDVPIGAGLSSSAAFELAVARAFALSSQIAWDPIAMASAAQHAENEWVGMACGVMDQLISAAGREDHALLIDCRSLEMRAVPLPAETIVVVLDTGTRRGLVGSAYNDRRRQCEAAAAAFGVPALRDVDRSVFDAEIAGLDAVLLKRARHVVSENERTLDAAEAMLQNDASRLGQLMSASHESLRTDFEVSSAALDTIVDVARAQPGCRGARMTGAGFGGCAVALVDRGVGDAFVENVTREYADRTGHSPHVFATRASRGTEVIGAE